MLLEFAVKNFRSFDSEQRLSMVASSSKELISENTWAKNGFMVTKIAVMYGQNASGKSNFIRAIDFMKDFVLDSSKEMSQGDEINISPFLFSADSVNMPSSFEVIFINDNVRYQYGFSLNVHRVMEEWLYAFPNGRSQKIFVRTYSDLTDSYSWSAPSLKGQREPIKNATRSNTLFLSTAAMFNNEQLMPVYLWFKDKLNVLTSGTVRPTYSSKLCLDKGSKKDQILKFLKEADLTVSDISIDSEKFDENSIPDSIPDAIREELRKELMGKELLRTFFHHRVKGSKSFARLSLSEESDGTQKLFELAGPWIDVIENGLVLVVDELDRSLHSNLMRFLLTKFLCGSTNDSGSQLIFTTHDTSLMSANILRRDQFWFASKDKYNATELYSLSDMSPRKGEALEKGYLQGRYGGIPLI